MKQIKFNETEKRVIRAIAATAIPDGGELNINVADIDVTTAGEKVIQGIEPDLRFAIRMLLKVFDYLPFLTIFKFKRFTNLTKEEQNKVLLKWHKSGFYYFRALYLAVTSMAFIGFYSDDKVRAAIGYDSHKGGMDIV